jgi:hypothetical protein
LYKNGELHRLAQISSDLAQRWYQHGMLHRDNDQPAIMYPTGYKEWYQYGKLHRDNDQPARILSDGSKMWYKDGEQLAVQRILN